MGRRNSWLARAGRLEMGTLLGLNRPDPFMDKEGVFSPRYVGDIVALGLNYAVWAQGNG